MKKPLLKSLLVIVLWLFSFLSLLPTFAVCEVQTITHSVRQAFGGSQSPDDARIAALAKAKREALEMAGTYVESLTVVKNARIEKDEILALAAGVLTAEVVSQKNYSTEDAFGIEIVVKVKVDTSVLETSIKKLLENREHLDELNRTRKREKELLDKMAKLEEENRRLMMEKKSPGTLKERFQETSRALSAVELVNKVYPLLTKQLKFSDPKKAIDYTTDAYTVRSWVYLTMGLYEHAIKDCNEAIRLKPDSSFAYKNRCWAYKELGKYERAIADCDKAIGFKPDDPWTYFNRALTYERMAFHSVFASKKYEQAIGDLSEAIRLQPDFALAYYSRGSIHMARGQYQRAIQDLSESIRLRPDFAEAYNNRGTAYLIQKNQYLGCPDLRKACELGTCKGLDWAKSQGSCR
jgi:tetratricopeptide (TPR) repeat protein